MFSALALCSLAYWMWVAFGTFRTLRRVPHVGPVEERLNWPRLSIVIPARNEAEYIETALRSRLDGYPNLEVVFVNDRSTDATGDVADALARQDSRLEVVHVETLAAGWLGKVHAMQRGFERTTGEWILFTDADVQLEPGALERVIAHAERERADHVTVLPRITARGLLLVPALSALVRLFSIGGRMWSASDPKSSAAVGVGAFNLVRRQAFLRTRGLEWLKMEAADDLGLAVMLKRSGARSLVLNGSDLVSLRFYPSFAAMTRSVEKNGGSAPFLALIVVNALLVLIEGGFLLGSPGLLVAGAVFSSVSTFFLSRFTRLAVWPAVLPVFGASLLAFQMVRSACLAWWRGGVVWRGTKYPLPAIRAGTRVGFVSLRRDESTATTRARG